MRAASDLVFKIRSGRFSSRFLCLLHVIGRADGAVEVQAFS